MIYVTSDTHFNHLKIIEYCNRPFTNIEDMNNVMINNWNSIVKENDKVVHLGDFGFGGGEELSEICAKLNGHKMLIKGNHDNRKTNEWWKNTGFNDVLDGGFIYKEFYLMSHKPLFINEKSAFINLHGHIHQNKMEGSQYYNVCVEHHNYTPIALNDIIKGYMLKKEDKQNDK